MARAGEILFYLENDRNKISTEEFEDVFRVKGITNKNNAQEIWDEIGGMKITDYRLYLILSQINDGFKSEIETWIKFAEQKQRRETVRDKGRPQESKVPFPYYVIKHSWILRQVFQTGSFWLNILKVLNILSNMEIYPIDRYPTFQRWIERQPDWEKWKNGQRDGHEIPFEGFDL